jgi:ribosomal protein S18 acetylase RimI-like enzyme
MRSTAAPAAHVIVRLAEQHDAPGFIALAAQVEHWFGPMVEDPSFHAAVDKHIQRATALVAVAATGTEVLGGLLLGVKPPTYHIHWLVVSAYARGQGIGHALIADAMHRYVQTPATVEVVTFGADHPGASTSGGRAFYERLGFTPAETADPGPEGGSRQVYRRTLL